MLERSENTFDRYKNYGNFHKIGKISPFFISYK